MKRIVPSFSKKKAVDNLCCSFKKLLQLDGNLKNADVVEAVDRVEKSTKTKKTSGSIIKFKEVRVLFETTSHILLIN